MARRKCRRVCRRRQAFGRSGESFRWPSFLPDGRHFLYLSIAGTGSATGISAASLDSKETRRIAVADSGAIYSPPGYVLFRTGDRLVAQPFDEAWKCDQTLMQKVVECGTCPLESLWLSAQCIASDDPRLKEK